MIMQGISLCWCQVMKQRQRAAQVWPGIRGSRNEISQQHCRWHLQFPLPMKLFTKLLNCYLRNRHCYKVTRCHVLYVIDPVEVIQHVYLKKKTQSFFIGFIANVNERIIQSVHNINFTISFSINLCIIDSA